MHTSTLLWRNEKNPEDVCNNGLQDTAGRGMRLESGPSHRSWRPAAPLGFLAVVLSDRQQT